MRKQTQQDQKKTHNFLKYMVIKGIPGIKTQYILLLVKHFSIMDNNLGDVTLGSVFPFLNAY